MPTFGWRSWSRDRKSRMHWRPPRHAWLHVAEGKVAVNGQELAAGDAAAFDAPSAAEVKALERAQVLLFDLN